MDRVAALLNDTNRTLFTYSAQVPHLNIAIQELREELELNNIPASNASSAVIPLLAEEDNIGGDGPPLPQGLIEIQQLWQTPTGTNQPYLPVTKYEYLPHYFQTGISYSVIPAWAWMEQMIKFVPCTADTDIKIDFIKVVIEDAINENSQLSLLNCENVLSYRTAGLCARFIGENPTRADSLDLDARLAFDRFLGISTKGRQNINTRRRPFMGSYKSRGVW